MPKKLGYGLIGCGNCGENKHLASYEKHPDDIKTIAVYDADGAKAKAVAEKHKVPKVYSSWEALLADPSIDIVSIATPNCFHAPMAISALKAGKHVHVEKPIAMNADEASAIVDARKSSGKKVMVALNNRFTETTQYAKRFVDEGRLGSIYHARCGWRRRMGCNMFGTWFANKKLSGGGPLIDLGVHFLDLTLHLMGYPAPKAVSAMCYDKIANPPGGEAMDSVMLGRNKAKGGYDVEDIAVGFARLETGASMSFEFSWASHVEKETRYIELLGSRGGLCMRDGLIKFYGEEAGALVDLEPQVKNTSSWGENETSHFIDCIKNDATPSSTPEDAYEMMLIIDAIYASAKLGREIAITTRRQA